MWRKAMLYLGLGPDEEYDDYDAGYEDEAGAADRGAASHGRVGSGVSSVAYADESSAIGAVRPINPRSDSQNEGGSAMGQTVTPTGGARLRPQVVRAISVTSNVKPHVVVPTSFNEAQELADKFKGNQPVIMNLQGADRDLARRLIDFASGLCYGLGGQMEKVANQVYLLTPSNVEVSPEERRRLQERGYDS
jgi:cell division inhibitor SepF